MHLCSVAAPSALRLGPRSWVFVPAFLKSKFKNAFGPLLAVLHDISGRRGYSGGEWVHLGKNKKNRKEKEEVGLKKKKRREIP
jgi:hypothetical protein